MCYMPEYVLMVTFEFDPKRKVLIAANEHINFRVEAKNMDELGDVVETALAEHFKGKDITQEYGLPADYQVIFMPKVNQPTNFTDFVSTFSNVNVEDIPAQIARGEDVFPLLDDALSGHMSIGGVALIQAFKDFNDQQGIQRIVEHIQSLTNENLIAGYLGLFAAIGSAAIPALRAWFEDHTLPNRSYAMVSLIMADRSHSQALIEAALNDEDEVVVQMAAQLMQMP